MPKLAGASIDLKPYAVAVGVVLPLGSPQTAVLEKDLKLLEVLSDESNSAGGAPVNSNGMLVVFVLDCSVWCVDFCEEGANSLR